ncbi:MAG: DUF2283 domain-containing protein [Pseudohongiella sp.]|jgi:uncharacterized protein YuzE|nr:DUF2283 domain-containing protein [Pseudohongiella sp.]MDP2091694.1 DUF2283 domain-containing protein [Pseudohongiella sp.]
MKLNYSPETDSLYIDLSDRVSASSNEISEGIVLDYDANGELVGIDIDNASQKVDLNRLTVSRLPGTIETEAA